MAAYREVVSLLLIDYRCVAVYVCVLFGMLCVLFGMLCFFN